MASFLAFEKLLKAYKEHDEEEFNFRLKTALDWIDGALVQSWHRLGKYTITALTANTMKNLLKPQSPLSEAQRIVVDAFIERHGMKMYTKRKEIAVGDAVVIDGATYLVTKNDGTTLTVLNYGIGISDYTQEFPVRKVKFGIHPGNVWVRLPKQIFFFFNQQ